MQRDYRQPNVCAFRPRKQWVDCEAERDAEILGVFSHINRLKILLMLRRERRQVPVLAAGLGVSRTTILKHLAPLLSARIVTVHHEGSSVYYELAETWGGFLATLLAIGNNPPITEPTTRAFQVFERYQDQIPALIMARSIGPCGCDS